MSGAEFLILAVVCLAAIAHLVGYIFIIIDMFQDEIWKGLVGLFCCELYVIWYAASEFDHEYKGAILSAFFIPLLLYLIALVMGVPVG